MPSHQQKESISLGFQPAIVRNPAVIWKKTHRSKNERGGFTLLDFGFNDKLLTRTYVMLSIRFDARKHCCCQSIGKTARSVRASSNRANQHSKQQI